MPPQQPRPKYVYKILPSSPPDPIPAEYPLSDLDQQDGFVHLSTARQVPITAGLFFGDVQELWVLKLRVERFASLVEWDEVPGANGGCPHLYGNFGAADVQGCERFTRSGVQDWAEAMRSHDFLL